MRFSQSFVNAAKEEFKRLKSINQVPKSNIGTAMTQKEFIQRAKNKVELASDRARYDANKIKRQMDSIVEDAMKKGKTPSKTVLDVYKKQIEDLRSLADKIESTKSFNDFKTGQRAAEQLKKDVIDVNAKSFRKSDIKFKKKEDKVEYEFNLMGVGRKTYVTLSDGSTYSYDDMKKALDNANIDVDKEIFSDDDITQTKYLPSTVSNFKGDFKSSMKNIVDASSELSERDKEGIYKLLGLEDLQSGGEYSKYSSLLRY